MFIKWTTASLTHNISLCVLGLNVICLVVCKITWAVLECWINNKEETGNQSNTVCARQGFIFHLQAPLGLILGRCALEESHQASLMKCSAGAAALEGDRGRFNINKMARRPALSCVATPEPVSMMCDRKITTDEKIIPPQAKYSDSTDQFLEILE